MIHWGWAVVALIFGFIKGMVVFYNSLKNKYPKAYLEFQRQIYEEAKRNDAE